ncbi:FkbM family methyltransferase [bacterium]|nr:FkbM family methyltransferase [bacterium]
MIDVFTDPFYRKYYDYDAPRPQPSDFAVKFFEGKRDGIFVDIGAADGIIWSNSLAFEINYNWSGLCIEAHPSTYKKLVENRKQTTCINLAVSDKEEDLNFVCIEGSASCISGLSRHFDNRHKDRIISELDITNSSASKLKVKAKPLQQILDEHKLCNIDYLSVDVEGAELAVLKGIDFNRTNISLISLEVNYELDTVVKELSNYGYKFLEKVCADAFFTRS